MYSQKEIGNYNCPPEDKSKGHLWGIFSFKLKYVLFSLTKNVGSNL